MHVVTHALIGWGIANLAPSLDRRARALAFWASVIPDLDGLTILGNGLWKLHERFPGVGPLAALAGALGPDTFEVWHRILCHNVLFAAICVALGGAFAGGLGKQRAITAGLVALNFHLHLVCDVLGSAGPDGSTWSIPYFKPFHDFRFDNPHQWALNAWPNILTTIVMLAWAVRLALTYGRTPLEPISRAADGALLEVLRRRFDEGNGPDGPRTNAG